MGELWQAVLRELSARGADLRLESALDGAALSLTAARDALRGRARELARAARYRRHKGGGDG